MTKRILLGILLAGASLLLFSCTSMDPEQRAQLVTTFNEWLSRGAITAEQHAILIAALVDPGGGGGEWWKQLLMLVIPIGLSLLGVPVVSNLTRGPTTNRKGLAESMANISQQQMAGARMTAAADAVQRSSTTNPA